MPDWQKTKQVNKISIKPKLQIAYKNLIRALDKRNRLQASNVDVVEYTRRQKVLKRKHHLSSKLKKISSKLCLLYSEPYIVNKTVCKNAYGLQDQDGKIMGTYNARYLIPHKQVPKLNNYTWRATNKINKVRHKNFLGIRNNLKHKFKQHS